MILTDYYKMEKLPTSKSKLRMDCTTSTGSYEPFEQRAQRCRDKRFKCYFSKTPENFSADAKRKADYSITDTDNISGVFCPDMEKPLLGYGDVEGTQDALLFIFAEGHKGMEIFIARGLSHNVGQLFNLFSDGELDEEIAELRKQAQPTNAPTGK